MGKADYVLSQRQTRAHTCHWPGCGKQVKPALWGCMKHWFMLPAHYWDHPLDIYAPTPVSTAHIPQDTEVPK
jgi:hypothetical protein